MHPAAHTAVWQSNKLDGTYNTPLENLSKETPGQGNLQQLARTSRPQQKERRWWVNLP